MPLPKLSCVVWGRGPARPGAPRPSQPWNPAAQGARGQLPSRASGHERQSAEGHGVSGAGRASAPPWPERVSLFLSPLRPNATLRDLGGLGPQRLHHQQALSSGLSSQRTRVSPHCPSKGSAQSFRVPRATRLGDVEWPSWGLWFPRGRVRTQASTPRARHRLLLRAPAAGPLSGVALTWCQGGISVQCCFLEKRWRLAVPQGVGNPSLSHLRAPPFPHLRASPCRAGPGPCQEKEGA